MASRFSCVSQRAAVGAVFYLISSLSLAFPVPSYVSNENHTVSDGFNNLVDLATVQVLEAPFPYEFPKEDNQIDLFPMPKCNGITLEEATIDQLQDAMSTGLLTTSQIVLCYMQRIYQTDMYLEYVFGFFAGNFIFQLVNQNLIKAYNTVVQLWS